MAPKPKAKGSLIPVPTNQYPSRGAAKEATPQVAASSNPGQGSAHATTAAPNTSEKGERRDDQTAGNGSSTAETGGTPNIGNARGNQPPAPASHGLSSSHHTHLVPTGSTTRSEVEVESQLIAQPDLKSHGRASSHQGDGVRIDEGRPREHGALGTYQSSSHRDGDQYVHQCM